MNTAQSITKTPLWVIENQTLKIIRLENEIRIRDREIKNLEAEKAAMGEKINSLQLELVEKKYKKKPNSDYRPIPKMLNRYISVQIEEDIIYEVLLKHFNVDKEKMLSKDRKGCVPIARHWLLYFLYTHTFKTYPELGREFNRDHTTIINSVCTIQKLLDVDMDVKKQYETLFAKCLCSAQK